MRVPERSWRVVPWPILLLLAAALGTQMTWRAHQRQPQAVAAALPGPPTASAMKVFSLGDTALASRWLMLWLQAFDNQPGISIAFRQLDYQRVIGWLQLALELDPVNPYPLLAASHLYAEVNDPPRQREMIEFIRRAFSQAPDQRWAAMAHTVFLARHRLQDKPLALALAGQLRAATDPSKVPGWARQMEIFVLEDIGEIEAARVMLGGLVASGEVTDPGELAFLQKRLAQMQADDSGNSH
ncbi:MAG: hypothetical protein H6978_11725 [Gammaproteobacteria bacterium]|nr:hypothetical protein [Gammaproteobacteria bacterium]